MENKSLLKDSIFAFITTIIGGALYFALDKIISNIYVTSFTSILFISVAFIIYGIKKSNKFSKILGINKLYPNHENAPKIDSIIKSANTSIDFLGISLRTIFETEGLKRILIEKVESGVTFRFLILDPESTYLIDKATDEGDNPEIWKHDIQSSISRLEEVQGKILKKPNLHVKKYDSMPNWRNIFVDNNLVYSSFYPHGARGKVAPVIIIENKQYSLYIPFKTEFEHLWSVSKDIHS